MVCADPLLQVSKYAGKVYSIAYISKVCDRLSFQTPSEAASRANAQQTTSKCSDGAAPVSPDTWATVQWAAEAQICAHVDWKGFQAFMSQFYVQF